MSTAPAAACRCCSKSLPRSEERRRLWGPSSKEVVQTFREFVSTIFPGSNFLPEVITEKSFLFLCKHCYARFVKYDKSRRELQQLNNSITNSIRSVGAVLNVQSVPASSSSIPDLGQVEMSARKRSMPPLSPETTPKRRRLTSVFSPGRKRGIPETSTPSPKRRRIISTPEHQALSKTVVMGTPVVSVLVKRKKGSRVYQLSRSLKRFGQSLGRSNRKSIARQAVNDARIRPHLIHYLSKQITKEMKHFCSDRVKSVLCSKNLNSVQSFDIKSIIQEMEKHSPSILSILRGCLAGRRASKAQKPRKFEVDHVVAVCCAILLRGRSQRMNLLQRIISLVLFSGHASKRVYYRLQKLCLCLSNKATIKCIDKFGVKYNEPVIEWKNRIVQDLKKEDQEQGSLEENPIQGREEPQNISPSFACYPDTGSSDNSSSSDSSQASTVSSGSSSLDSSVSSEDSVFSFTDIFGEESSAAPTSQSLPTYKLVGDNFDKNVTPRHMTLDNQTKSLHYFHVYGIRDRIDLSHYSDVPPNPTAIDFTKILPSKEDQSHLKHNFSIMIARVLKKYMPYFKKFGSGLERHIRHEYYEEMSMKSKVVPLGIILKSETSHAEMIEILEDLHQYVPRVSSTSEKSVTVDGTEEVSSIFQDTFHKILLGGDQLTAARVRGAKKVRSDSERPLHRLEGLEAACEDWHAKGVLLGTAWKRLYNTMSGINAGTMYQLRNLINRRNVVKDPTDNVAACEEFFLLLTEAHILAAAMTLFSMKTLEDTPVHEVFCSDSADSLQRRNSLIEAANLIVEKFIDIGYNSEDENVSSERAKRKGNTSKSRKKKQQDQTDRVKEYASEVLNFGLLLMELIDGVREGDGNRIERCWKFFMLLFKANGRKNYAIEALHVLIQLKFTLSPRMAAQLKWNRTVNVHGKPGKNISSDIHMEHLNRVCKTALSGMGSNITDTSVTRVGRSIKILNDTMQSLDEHLGVPAECGTHSRRSHEKDLKKVLKVIFEDNPVFSSVPGRSHTHFPNFEQNSMRTITAKKLNQWLKMKADTIITSV